MTRRTVAVLAALLVAAASASLANAAGRCAPYGDEDTDFTWRLCPAGEKFERRYLYFGVWSDFYRIAGDAGACEWSGARSSWVCPDKTIRCDSKSCGLR